MHAAALFASTTFSTIRPNSSNLLIALIYPSKAVFPLKFPGGEYLPTIT